ncbi:MAG: LysR family transcriptional regulator [Rhodobacterales bacterium]|nr:LysR family transcriptional regulator [Rhodobacterales bacterium]
MTLRKKLPSAQSLFAFESAARTLNFTDAGALLNVTQPAISKNIAALETHLGTRLFLRKKNGLALTTDGDTLHRAVQLSFTAIEVAIDQISNNTSLKNVLTLSLSTSFAAHWLIPQMPEFRRSFPDVTLNFQLAGGEVTGPLGACDLGLRLENKVAPEDHPIPFAPEWLVAVASPEYIKKNGMLDAPFSGGSHSLVKLDNPRISWQDFLGATSQSADPSLPEVRVPDYSVVLQTALSGRGVALGYVTSCSYLLREGLLMPALPKTLKTNKNYCMVTNPNSNNLQLAEEVRHWINNQSSKILTDISTTFSEFDVVAPGPDSPVAM